MIEVKITDRKKNITYTARIGQNKNENHQLICSSNPHDMWFHLKDISSCHLVLAVPEKNKGISRKVIKQCAVLTKEHTSKAVCLRDVSVIYTRIINLKKTERKGEVILDKDVSELTI